MRTVLTKNKAYFLIILLYFIACGLLLLQINKGDIIFFFSENRSPFGDLFFKYATTFGEEWVYVALMLLLSFYRFRLAIIVPLIGGTVMIISNLTKAFFAHHRPIAFFRHLGIDDQLNLVEGVHLFSGPTSFPSGHTMSAFALYTFLALSLRNKGIASILIAITAIIVGISRIYLVQHFLEDITLGAFMGIIIALIAYSIQSNWAYKPESRWIDRHIYYKKTIKQA